jgi:hypothetical protein
MGNMNIHDVGQAIVVIVKNMIVNQGPSDHLAFMDRKQF